MTELIKLNTGEDIPEQKKAHALIVNGAQPIDKPASFEEKVICVVGSEEGETAYLVENQEDLNTLDKIHLPKWWLSSPK